MKTCNRCGIAKPVDSFSRNSHMKDGLRSYCRECAKEMNKKWNAENAEHRRELHKRRNITHKEHIAAKNKEFYEKNREESIKRVTAWRKAHRDSCNALRRSEAYKKRRREESRRRYKEDPEYRIRVLIGNRMRCALQGKNKTARTMEILGCSLEYAKNHIESKFKCGMIWGNHGEWEIDHIIPISWFDLQDWRQAAIACNFSNLQPLWKNENASKNSRYAG